MGISEQIIDNAVTSSVISNLSKYWWVLAVFIGLGILFAIGGLAAKALKVKKQWTHKLYVKRILNNNMLSSPVIIKMKRYVDSEKHITKLFQLETALLGSYLIPEPQEYSGINEYSIIISRNNRVFLNIGERFCPIDSSINVSARHAEIDLQIDDLTKTVKVTNQSSKKLDWSAIAKYGIMLIGIIAICIISIYGIQNWAAAQDSKAQSDLAFADAMESLVTMSETMEATVNTQALEITPMIKLLYNNSNIQSLINSTRTNT